MSVVSLADAKTHLNENTASNDAEIQRMIDAAEAATTARIGPLSVITVSNEPVRGYTYWLRLQKFPIASLTSVTPVGTGATALDLTTLTVPPDGLRLVEYTFGGWFGARWYTVTYTAGRAVSTSLFQDIYGGLLEMIRHLWQTQRGSAGGSARYSGHGTPLDTIVPGSAYTFTNRVMEFMLPYYPPGVA